MVRGPLGEVVSEAGPSVQDGIAAPSYKCFRVASPEAGVCEIVLSRPQAMNTMSIDFIRELHQILDVLQYPLAIPAEEVPCRVLILRGEGRAFCAGLDLKDTRFGKVDQPYQQHAFSSVIKKFREIPQAVVCGINGIAAGGGMSLALVGDVCLGVPGTRYLPSYVKLGLGGGELGTSYFLPRIVGRQRAASILLTGREIDAETALSWGLLAKLVSSEADLALECRKVASDMLSLSPKGLRYTKWLLNNSQEMSMAQALDREDLAQNFMVADPESQAFGRKHTSKFRKSKL